MASRFETNVGENFNGATAWIQEGVQEVKQFFQHDLPDWYQNGMHTAGWARYDLWRNSEQAPERVQQRCSAITDPAEMKSYVSKVREGLSSPEAKTRHLPSFEITDSCAVNYEKPKAHPVLQAESDTPVAKHPVRATPIGHAIQVRDVR